MKRTMLIATVGMLGLGLCGAGIAQAAVHDVTVGPGGNMVFEPANIVIQIGDTVRWTWDSDGHNVGSGVPGVPTPYFLSGPPAPAGTIFQLAFDTAFLINNPVPGNFYDYHCHPHGPDGMIGSITIQSSVDVPVLGIFGQTLLIAVLLVGVLLVIQRRTSRIAA